MTVVQEILGSSTVRMTERCARLSLEYLLMACVRSKLSHVLVTATAGTTTCKNKKRPQVIEGVQVFLVGGTGIEPVTPAV